MHADTFRHAPDLLGVVELEMDGERIDIAALQRFVPNAGDGWSWLLGELIHADRRDSLVEAVSLLGTRTGELHLALSQDLGSESFTPEIIGEDEAQTIIRRVIAEMEGSVEGLTHHLPPDEIERLHKGLGAMMGDAWSMIGTALIRVHGDYHLGQTLRTRGDDFVIIDFEGEPSRTMEERRRKLPALKDVAGMVRSLDYAGATLIQQSDDAQERADIAAWVKGASEAFVIAYRDAISASQLPLVPAGDDAFASVLNLMIAEKALYELRYEMNNRPDWLWIPLDALLRLVSTEEVE
jgi:trehalose synthase-fused probable maltokinase